MKILITSIDVTGKSSFRKKLYAFLNNINHNLIIFDFDLDYDRNKLPAQFEPDRVYLLEDVHGPTTKAVFPLKDYDFIFYLLPSWQIHFKFWLDRMLKWYENGKFAWDADKGKKGAWAGTGKPHDWRNIPGIVKYFGKHFPKRGGVIKSDLETIKAAKIPTLLVIPLKENKKISFLYKHLE
ncbi:MAG: hypothetical protein NTX00_05780 [Candidatus Parcubacteria bacterium]|nr:hypothetical protein [Candidatus Parcubacteria bacterium]